MASFKTLFLLVALFAAVFAVEEKREKKGIAVTGVHGLGGYYGSSVLPYAGHGYYGGLGYGLGYGGLGYLGHGYGGLGYAGLGYGGLGYGGLGYHGYAGYPYSYYGGGYGGYFHH